MSLIPRLRGVEYAGAVPNRPGVPDAGPGGNEYGGEYPVPMTTGGPQVSGIQEYLAKLGLQPNAQNVNRARVGDTSAAPSKTMDVLPPRADRSITPNAASDSATPTGGDVRVGMPQVETPAMLPDAMGMIPDSAVPAAGLAAGAAGAGGLGALILRMLTGGGSGAPVVPSITPTGAGMPQPALPAPTPALPPVEMSPRIGASPTPVAIPGVPDSTLLPPVKTTGGALAPPANPPIALPSVPTGNPAIPLSGPGTTPRATPETTPKGPGFESELAPAIDKAVEGPPAKRARNPNRRVGGRVKVTAPVK